MVGWHHRLNGHEFEQVLGVGDGQGGLVSMGSMGHGHGVHVLQSMGSQSRT